MEASGVHPSFGGFRPRFRPLFAGRRVFFHPDFFRDGVWVNGWWRPAVVAGAWWGGYG